MKNFISIIKNSSLYLVAMVTALALTYYLGLAPLLHAQADFPDMPEFPQATAITSAPAQVKPPATNATQPVSTSSIPALPSENNVAVPDLPATAPTPTPAPAPRIPAPPVSRPNVSNAEGILFKHTKSYVGELGNPDRDPFRKPLYILEIEEKSLKPQKVTQEARIDDKMEAIRRWPLRDYRLVGVIWDVSNPKAMIIDPTNTMHLLKRNYRIGDKDGIISTISEGSITVIQDNIPVVIGISGSGSNN